MSKRWPSSCRALKLSLTIVGRVAIGKLEGSGMLRLALLELPARSRFYMFSSKPRKDGKLGAGPCAKLTHPLLVYLLHLIDLKDSGACSILSRSDPPSFET